VEEVEPNTMTKTEEEWGCTTMRDLDLLTYSEESKNEEAVESEHGDYLKSKQNSDEEKVKMKEEIRK